MKRSPTGRGFAARLFRRVPDSLETSLDRALGLRKRGLRCVASAEVSVAAGSRVLAAWTDSATEPRARAFLPEGADMAASGQALALLCLPLACRIGEEAPIGEADPRLDGIELRFYIVSARAPAWRRSGAVESPKPEAGQPILVLRGPVPGDPALAASAEGDGVRSPPECLAVEAPAAPGALACILPHEFEAARGVLACVLPRSVRSAGAEIPRGDATRFRCSLRLGSSALAWTMAFPAVPPADPSGAAMRARFGALAAGQTRQAARFLASLGLTTADPRAEAVDAPASAPAPRLKVEATLRLGLRDLPLAVELDAAALGILARLAGLKPGTRALSFEGSEQLDGEDADLEAELLRFLEANRRLSLRLEPLSRKAFAAKPGLARLLLLLDSGDRARLMSRLVASKRPAELIEALYAKDPGSGRPLPRGFFRDADLLDTAPGTWLEDFKLALSRQGPRLAQDEEAAAALDLALLGFLDQELRAGRLELSARGKALLAPIRDQGRAREEKAFRELCAKDGFWQLLGGAGRRLGASALVALNDRDLAMASVAEIERRADLAPLMSRGRRRAFGEEAAWIDARYASGDLSPGSCAESRRRALRQCKARLEQLKRTEAEERARELSERRARSGPAASPGDLGSKARRPSRS